MPLPEGRVLRVELSHRTAGRLRQAKCVRCGAIATVRRLRLMGVGVRRGVGRPPAPERPRELRQRLVNARCAGQGREIADPQGLRQQDHVVLIEPPPPGARSSRKRELIAEDLVPVRVNGASESVDIAGAVNPVVGTALRRVATVPVSMVQLCKTVADSDLAGTSVRIGGARVGV